MAFFSSLVKLCSKKKYRFYNKCNKIWIWEEIENWKIKRSWLLESNHIWSHLSYLLSPKSLIKERVFRVCLSIQRITCLKLMTNKFKKNKTTKGKKRNVILLTSHYCLRLFFVVSNWKYVYFLLNFYFACRTSIISSTYFFGFPFSFSSLVYWAKIGEVGHKG